MNLETINFNAKKVVNFISRKFLILFMVYLLLPDCSTFGPRNAQSSLIIVYMILEKDELLLDEFVDPRFQKATLRKGDSVYEYSENSDHYYYFQNLKEGNYEIHDAAHLLNRGASDFAYGSTKQPMKIDFDFLPEDIESSKVNLEPGAVVFMGTISAKVKFRFKEDPEIALKFTKSIEEERAAFEYLYKNYPRNGWGQKAKARLKLINSIIK